MAYMVHPRSVKVRASRAEIGRLLAYIRPLAGSSHSRALMDSAHAGLCNRAVFEDLAIDQVPGMSVRPVCHHVSFTLRNLDRGVAGSVPSVSHLLSHAALPR